MQARRFRHSLVLVAAALLLAGCATRSVVSPPPMSAPAADAAALESTVRDMNAAMTRRDIEAAMAVFEDSDRILLVGSDSGEVFRARDGIRRFLTMLMGLPFTFSFEMPVTVARVNADTAWLYVDGFMVHTAQDGVASQQPYRFSVFAVRSHGVWRWQLFHGSVPGAE